MVNAYFAFPAHSPPPLIDPVGRLISCFIAVRAMEFLNNFALFVYPSGECGRQPGGASHRGREGGRVGLQACPACPKKNAAHAG